MISVPIVEQVDKWLDAEVAYNYKDQPLAQDWARISKVIEELGESIKEMILFTGQNPRKGTDPDAKEHMLDELADTALTAIYAIQHFTKDRFLTTAFLLNAQARHSERAESFGYRQEQ